MVTSSVVGSLWLELCVEMGACVLARSDVVVDWQVLTEDSHRIEHAAD